MSYLLSSSPYGAGAVDLLQKLAIGPAGASIRLAGLLSDLGWAVRLDDPLATSQARLRLTAVGEVVASARWRALKRPAEWLLETCLRGEVRAAVYRVERDSSPAGSDGKADARRSGSGPDVDPHKIAFRVFGPARDADYDEILVGQGPGSAGPTGIALKAGVVPGLWGRGMAEAERSLWRGQPGPAGDLLRMVPATKFEIAVREIGRRVGVPRAAVMASLSGEPVTSSMMRAIEAVSIRFELES